MNKRERLAEVFRRLSEAAPFISAWSARTFLDYTINKVEDEFSGEPFDTNDTARRCFRLYPAADDLSKSKPGVHVSQSDYETVLIGNNGAIVIRSNQTNEIVFCKHGCDGLLVKDT